LGYVLEEASQELVRRQRHCATARLAAGEGRREALIAQGLDPPSPQTEERGSCERGRRATLRGLVRRPYARGQETQSTAARGSTRQRFNLLSGTVGSNITFLETRDTFPR
jgi:hypothetical protein